MIMLTEPSTTVQAVMDDELYFINMMTLKDFLLVSCELEEIRKGAREPGNSS